MKESGVEAFACFKNEIWCRDLAYVDKLTKGNNAVKYLLVRQDLFARTVDAKRMEPRDSREMVRSFLTMIELKKIDPRKNGWTRERNLLESVKIYAKLKEFKFFPQ